MVAQSATTNEMTLVTRNVSDFEAAGVKMVNPWE
jgi:predicted nucleic acid-binding protein